MGSGPPCSVKPVGWETLHTRHVLHQRSGGCRCPREPGEPPRTQGATSGVQPDQQNAPVRTENRGDLKGADHASDRRSEKLERGWEATPKLLLLQATGTTGGYGVSRVQVSVPGRHSQEAGVELSWLCPPVCCPLIACQCLFMTLPRLGPNAVESLGNSACRDQPTPLCPTQWSRKG